MNSENALKCLLKYIDSHDKIVYDKLWEVIMENLCPWDIGFKGRMTCRNVFCRECWEKAIKDIEKGEE